MRLCLGCGCRPMDFPCAVSVNLQIMIARYRCFAVFRKHHHTDFLLGKHVEDDSDLRLWQRAIRAIQKYKSRARE